MVQISWRTGVNMREFAYYGTPARQFTSAGLQRQQLEQLRGLQVQLVRFYASYNQFSPAQCIQQVLATLNLLQEFGMQGIICLADSLSSEFSIAGDGEYHTGPLGHLVKQYWLDRAYERHYLPFLNSLVGACAHHPAALMWELGNEYAIHPQPASFDDGQAFLAFARTASGAIKQAAPNTLVSTGLVGSHHVAPAGLLDPYGRELYGLPTLDAISIHFYADDGEEMSAQRERSLAQSLGKPFYVGEFGAPANWPNRAAFYQGQLDRWSKAGAFTALLWAFDSSPSDIGVSDDKAFARCRPDFEPIQAALRAVGRPAEPVVIHLLEPVHLITATKSFTITDGPVFVRRFPSLAPDARIPGQQIETGQKLEVDSGSRTAADGFVWWRHAGGWSAEASEDRRLVFMVDTEVAPQGPALVQPRAAGAPFAPLRTRTFRVIDGPVRVRDHPTLEPRALIKDKNLRTGQDVDVDADSRTEAEGYVWWQHKDGWSVERGLHSPEVFMIDKKLMLDPGDLFERLPLAIDQVRWTQYYGNTTFAFAEGQAHGYDNYSQGLHGGIDLGNPGEVPVCAGIRADLNPICTYVGDQRAFRPNRVDVEVGPFKVVFGHLIRPDFTLQNKAVAPDTVLGFVGAPERHLHLEIRNKSETRIMNPFNFLPDALRDLLLQRFPADEDYQPNHGQWETPLDQPEIIVGGKVIGPRGRP